MSEYYWDSQIEYLKRTRDLYYNDDYLEFLVKSVWRITEPVNIIDFGCGFGYLGLKLLPLLPEGSRYTGIDKGEQLIKEARELFKPLPYDTEFIVADMNNIELEKKYDMAVCHAFLLHIANPKSMLQKMVNSLVDKGKIICFEPHWISSMASYYINGYDQSQMIQLGALQKLFEYDAKQNRKNGNIGAKIPIYLTELGVENIQCRISDKVNVLYPNMNQEAKDKLFFSLKEDGIGAKPLDKEAFIDGLSKRGLTINEAEDQFNAEFFFSQNFNEESSLTYAALMRITSGEVIHM
ncbi:class I SAM-dependent methyltransferase [Heyndrickxia oleronia]|uniref:methyltransferase domain-containing protein n=1 Tax=Heyndrickxia oleronia TaxID=38875 RepID=UPI00203AC380|nr:methyltransferase domain-containing protein [Heyndrickxia oleronia]MCM3237422.1 class I SAM-dependent methyltransferase [Heyndrickxia oleronia]